MLIDYGSTYDILTQGFLTLFDLLGIHPFLIDRIIAIISITLTIIIFNKQRNLQKQSDSIINYNARVSKFLVGRYYLPLFMFKRIVTSNLDWIERKIEDNITIIKNFNADKDDPIFFTEKINRNMKMIGEILHSIRENLDYHGSNLIKEARYNQLYIQLSNNQSSMGLGGSEISELMEDQKRHFIDDMETFRTDINEFRSEIDSDHSEMEKLRKVSEKINLD